jgi:2,3-bisphosphoglycerate-independent phosphoglycerate mutase
MAWKQKPLVLIILDGWGHGPEGRCNAISAARKPVWDRLWAECPHTLVHSSGVDVGLPDAHMGNSEVGHLNMGAGRVIYQELTRISRAVETGEFYTNPVLTGAVDQAVTAGKAVHILGLLSPGGVHSHESHIQSMMKLAVQRGAGAVYLHVFLDGRDTAPTSAAGSIAATEQVLSDIGGGRIASVIGRYYAMDRDHRWPRIKAAYDLICDGKAAYTATSAREALDMAYARGETDEFVQGTAIVPPGAAPVTVNDGDTVIFMNFRSDRARQITRAFIEPVFDGFPRERWPRLGTFVTLTEYHKDFHVPVAFPAERLRNVFGQYISEHGLRQLRIAETEKYAHVTFFFNGGEERPFPGEDRVLVPSPTDIPTYDLKPEMSAPEVTDRLVDAIEHGGYDVIICNYANTDMVGHSGRFDAVVKAIEAVDQCLGRVVTAMRKVGGELVITADHGNAEMMCVDGGHIHTAHTNNPVPLIYMGRPARLRAGGRLSDVSPTLLYLMGMDKPQEMTGSSLVTLT